MPIAYALTVTLTDGRTFTATERASWLSDRHETAGEVAARACPTGDKIVTLTLSPGRAVTFPASQIVSVETGPAAPPEHAPELVPFGDTGAGTTRAADRFGAPVVVVDGASDAWAAAAAAAHYAGEPVATLAPDAAAALEQDETWERRPGILGGLKVGDRILIRDTRPNIGALIPVRTSRVGKIVGIGTPGAEPYLITHDGGEWLITTGQRVNAATGYTVDRLMAEPYHERHAAETRQAAARWLYDHVLSGAPAQALAERGTLSALTELANLLIGYGVGFGVDYDDRPTLELMDPHEIAASVAELARHSRSS